MVWLAGLVLTVEAARLALWLRRHLRKEAEFNARLAEMEKRWPSE